VQQVAWSVFEQIWPAEQFPVQLRVVFVHGSGTEPQNPLGQVSGVQHWFASEPPEAPHCVPGSSEHELLLHVRTFPLHGSVHVPPQ
jgi:hypothetical protein